MRTGLDDATVHQPWRVTHRITFTRSAGRVEIWNVMVVLTKSGAGPFWPAATEREWDHNFVPAWACDAHGRWTFRGATTPQDASGTLTIEWFDPRTGRLGKTTSHEGFNLGGMESTPS